MTVVFERGLHDDLLLFLAVFCFFFFLMELGLGQEDPCACHEGNRSG